MRPARPLPGDAPQGRIPRRGRPPQLFVLGRDEKGEPVLGTFRDLGITRRRAREARQVGAIPEDVFEELIESDDPPTKAELLRIAARYTDAALEPPRIKVSQTDPARAAWTIVSRCSPGYVGELVAFLQEYQRRAGR